MYVLLSSRPYSVRKYEAMTTSTNPTDHRVRGLMQFHGAARTGRWAGRLIQVQNLPRNYLPDLDAARALVKDRNQPALEMLYDSVPDVLSQLIRTAFIPREGCEFIVADYSAIEARVIAWLARSGGSTCLGGVGIFTASPPPKCSAFLSRNTG